MREPYVYIQLGQLLAWLICVTVTRHFLKQRKLTWRTSPYLLICFGYYLACIASNVLRYLLDDRTALWVIDVQDYLHGTVAWFGCLVISTAGYLLLRKRPSLRIGLVRTTTNRLTGSRLEIFYAMLFLAGVIGYVENPFRGMDYGQLAPKSYESILTGGLMVAGVCTAIAASGAVPLFIMRPAVGLPCIATMIVLLTYSGSKAMGAVFSVYILSLIFTLRKQIRFRRWSWIGMTASAFIAFASLIASNAFRFQTSEVSTANAFAASLGRFTHQEVMAVLWANPDWRSISRADYIYAEVASFVPGFLWEGKPRNPALEINRLYVHNGSPAAASPFVFGSLMIATNSVGMFFATLLFAGAMAVLDSRLCGLSRYLHLEWTYLYCLVMVFETVYLVGVILMAVLLVCAWVISLSEVPVIPIRRSTTSGNRPFCKVRPSRAARDRGKIVEVSAGCQSGD